MMLEGLLQLDGAILLWIQEVLRGGILDPILSVYTKLGDVGFLWIASSLLMLFFPKTRKAGLLALLSLALGTLCTNVVLKHLVARTRPWLVVDGLVPLVVEHDPNSFPSGHTSAAFAVAGIWLRALPKRWMGILGLVLAALMGLSRLYVGVHFPSDVLAGAAVGLLCSQIIWRCWEKYAARRGRQV